MNPIRKGLTVAIIVLFIIMAVNPATSRIIDKTNYDSINRGINKELIEEKHIGGQNGLSDDNPPVVEILSPEDDSIIYTRYTNISIVCSDDTALRSAEIEYGGEYYTIGYGTGVYPPCQIYYLNRSMEKIRPGYVWIVARAYDEDGNIGMDTAVVYYNDSNDPDLYPPEIRIWNPRVGSIYLLGKEVIQIFQIINYSIVVGKFKIDAIVEDPEGNLQIVELYIDNELVFYQDLSNDWFEIIVWNCKKFIFGMHEIKIVAKDSYNNSATEKLSCFIINFI